MNPKPYYSVHDLEAATGIPGRTLRRYLAVRLASHKHEPRHKYEIPARLYHEIVGELKDGKLRRTKQARGGVLLMVKQIRAGRPSMRFYKP